MEKQQLTLDHIVLEQLQKKFEDLKAAVNDLREILTKVELEVGILRGGCETMFHSLEINGLLIGGEPNVPGSNPGSEKVAEKGPCWDPGKIPWIQAQGSKGVYEKSEDVDNVEFKKMVKDLAAHKGKLWREGFFYWVFTNGGVVGRKRRGKS